MKMFHQVKLVNRREKANFIPLAKLVLADQLSPQANRFLTATTSVIKQFVRAVHLQHLDRLKDVEPTFFDVELLLSVRIPEYPSHWNTATVETH